MAVALAVAAAPSVSGIGEDDGVVGYCEEEESRDGQVRRTCYGADPNTLDPEDPDAFVEEPSCIGWWERTEDQGNADDYFERYSELCVSGDRVDHCGGQRAESSEPDMHNPGMYENCNGYRAGCVGQWHRDGDMQGNETRWRHADGWGIEIAPPDGESRCPPPPP